MEPTRKHRAAEEARPRSSQFLATHFQLTRRYFLKLGATGAAAFSALELSADGSARNTTLQKAIDAIEPWLTKQDDFGDVSRGDPIPHTLSAEQRAEVGLTRDNWQLEISSDPEHKARIKKPFTKEANNAFNFNDLLQLSREHVVRFPKIMTCLNMGCPLGNGIWEGIPLRELIWLTQPTENLRRIFYYGYHNDDPKQVFRSSLPVGRVLEDPHGLPPVIVCYKLNEDWLTPERGGPVRIVVPEAYGFKSIKWLSHIVLSNRWTSNDTYGEQNNDVDSPMKTFCETLTVPERAQPNEPFAVTGYAQVGISGLKKVQVWIQNNDEPLPDNDPHFTSAPWMDTELLPAPQTWGGELPDGRIPTDTRGFDDTTGRPQQWPLPLTKVHWATLLPGLATGRYTLRCRTIDGNDHAQPMPRPFRKSGRAAIQKVRFMVEA
ncbi:MAG: molybdopterin-dependent oxidoreductase [Pirellulaceae bacterium]|nr:molybdopterin-dependent oxidoreductase [Pirellulaceae bacterium]